MAKKKATKSPSLVDVRKSLGLNQKDFWGKLGVTQSGGSRYESGRKLPKPVRMLVELTYGTGTLDELRSGELVERL